MEKGIRIQYHSGIIPPPYAYEQAVEINLNPFDVKFNHIYIDREELSEDDILDEGFTGEDDFQWTGSLPIVWKESLEALLDKSSWQKQTKEKEPQMDMLLVRQEGEKDAKQPGNQSTWMIWLQELFQACLEKEGLEKMLEIHLLQNAPSKSDELTIKASFVNRSAQLMRNGQELEIRWDFMNSITKKLFALDFYPEKAREAKPTQKGLFIDLGDGLWYEKGKSVKNPNSKTDVFGDVMSILTSL